MPRPSLAGDGATVTTWVGYETRRVGAIVHAERLLDDAAFTETFVPLLRIAMERDRLYRDLVAKLEQLKASRLRILQAGDDERRRLERNLHDGAQQRLTAALLGVRAVAGQVADDPRARAACGGCPGRPRGRHRRPAGACPRPRPAAARPPGARRGDPCRRGACLAARRARSRLPQRLAPALEAAAYYVCAEAVTNTVKHARATQAWLRVVDDGPTLTVTVRDDGIGGACIECQDEATGLGGLVDRVETLGGTLEVVSPDGAGTILTAVFPLAADPHSSITALP